MTRRPTPKSNKRRSRASRQSATGLESRLLALEVLESVLVNRRGLDEALELGLANERFASMEQRDKGFARLLGVTVLRNKRQLQKIIDDLLERPLKARATRANLILLLGAAQLLKLAAPAHAVIDTAVNLCRLDRSTGGFDRLTNAVLRRVALPETHERFANLDSAENVPAWMLQRWQEAYGAEATAKIARACLQEAPLDISVKTSPDTWAEQLEGIVVATGSVRRRNDGRIEDLPGYNEGAWWVQDAAAALPVRLLGDVSGLHVADLCAAPGGKTAQLATAGATVAAVDISRSRLNRVEQNLARLQCSAKLVVADASTWSVEDAGMLFDAVLVDVPCTATGTIRRHPDILHLKQPDDASKLAATQAKILMNAANLTKTGGALVYCTCSMEPEEGEGQIERFLKQHSEFVRKPITPDEVGSHSEMLTSDGDLRTLPFHLDGFDDGLTGLDGFYACRLVRQ
ncbi:MAG: transcription antitermination factor NusB [Pseudomonadota bacterium]